MASFVTLAFLGSCYQSQYYPSIPLHSPSPSQSNQAFVAPSPTIPSSSPPSAAQPSPPKSSAIPTAFPLPTPQASGTNSNGLIFLAIRGLVIGSSGEEINDAKVFLSSLMPDRPYEALRFVQHGYYQFTSVPYDMDILIRIEKTGYKPSSSRVHTLKSAGKEILMDVNFTLEKE